MADQQTQVVLRGFIEKAQSGRLQELTPDEVELARDRRDALAKRGDGAPDAEKKLLSVFESLLAKYDDFVAAQPSGDTAERAPGKSAGATAEIENRIDAASDFSGQAKSHMSLLEDVEVDISVRTFEYSGETTIDGDVPTDVLVIIRDGGVTVDGFVTGNVVATGDIRINGNVQGGTVISNEGNISVERALLNTKLIAKKGNITCQHIEAPRRVFAWETLTVGGSVLGGVLCGRNIRIAERVASGEIHSCGEVTAASFEIAREQPPAICLRDSLTCEDYMRPLDKSTVEQQQRMRQLETNIETAIHMDRFTNQLIHDCFRTALFYLLGGVESASAATSLQGLNTRSVYMKQILALAEGVAKYYASTIETLNEIAGQEEDGSQDAHETGEDLDRFKDENQQAFALIQADVEALPNEFGATNRRYLLDRCAELKSMLKRLHEEYLEARASEYIRSTFNTSLTKWRGALGDCDREIKSTIRNFGLDAATLKRIETESDSLDVMLEEAVAEKLRSTYAEDVQRAESPLIRILKTSAERYGRNIEKSRKAVKEAREELHQIRDALSDDSAVLFGDPASGSCSVSGGRFERGTTISTSPGEREGFDTNLARTIVLSEDINAQTRFERQGQLIQRIA